MEALFMTYYDTFFCDEAKVADDESEALFLS